MTDCDFCKLPAAFRHIYEPMPDGTPAPQEQLCDYHSRHVLRIDLISKRGGREVPDLQVVELIT